MFAALVVFALLALGMGVVQRRSRRAAQANRLLHTIVATMEALERGEVVDRPRVSASLLLGRGLAASVNGFFAAAADSGQDRERVFALGEAVLRELRDISTHRDHKWVSRA